MAPPYCLTSKTPSDDQGWSARYEFKQGILRLDDQRQIDNSIFSSLIETPCGIANVGADADGNIFLGVADKKIDTDRIVALDGVTPYME
jgi:predicted HTH transcriptional regulator